MKKSGYISGVVSKGELIIPEEFRATGTVYGVGNGFNHYQEVPDVWRCAYCSQLQSKIKDVIIRAHKIQEHVHKCSVCGAPKTEMKYG